MKMSTLRRWHFYAGMFTAPSVLFFAVTGAVQLFGLHEAHGDYDPPGVIEKLSSVHKDQVFAFGHHHRDPGAAKPPPAGAGKPADDDKEGWGAAMLKVFFLVVAVGLTASTAAGVWIGLARLADRRIAWGLLIAGTVIPVVLAAL